MPLTDQPARLALCCPRAHGEILYSLREAHIVVESWLRHSNTIRPHASLGYRPPAFEVFTTAQRPEGDATPDGSAGQAGANDNLELTFNPDHYVEADRFAVVVLIRSRYPLVMLLSTVV